MKVLGFGEALLRISPNGCYKLNQVNTLNYSFAGAELNVMVNLSVLGIKTAFLTKFPNNEIGDLAIENIDRYKVDTSNVIRGGDRVGVYFIEHGAGLRPTKVIYDRKYSSISMSSLKEYNFNTIFDGIDVFHISGITPALSKEISNVSVSMIKEAKRRGITTSFDFNFRSKLWSKEEAKGPLLEILKYSDFVFGLGLYEAENVLGINLKDNNINTIQDFAKYLTENFNIKGYATTLRESFSATKESITAVLYKDNEFYETKKYSIDIVDRIGTGDAFTSGILYGIINNFDNQKTLDFGIASCVLCHSIEGDFNLIKKDDIIQLVENPSLKVSR